MRRFLLPVFSFLLAGAGACSLINAPPEVNPGGSGGSGGGTTTTTTATTTTGTGGATTTTGTGGTGGTGGMPPMCTTNEECAAFGDQCSFGRCVDGTCTKLPDGAKEGLGCDDALQCTEADVCLAGVCTGTPVFCPASDACHSGKCTEDALCIEVADHDGDPCEDGDLCSSGETCFAGTCQGAQPTDCSAINGECSIGSCVDGLGCVPTPINENVPCALANPCADSLCIEGKCQVNKAKNVGTACNDDLFCTTSETCQASGFCGGGNPTCVKPAPCIDVVCNEAALTCDLMPILNGQPCEDGNICTGGETCNNNVCSGGTMGEVYFVETFANNAQGWLLGQEWQIGSAKASVPVVLGPDPGLDHTLAGDNGVAGVVIGGNAAQVVHPAYFLESPPVDVTVDGGKLFLTFYRWLNSDYLPYMRNFVEVFDGAAWVEVWSSGPPPGVEDAPPVGTGWTFQSFDITPYKNAALKVRFGFEIKSNGVFSVSSWNVDDVKLQNTPCPN